METKIKRDRKVRKGFDTEKLVKIWKVLMESQEWLVIAEIARRASINQCTVRWYLDKYLRDAIIEQTVAPTVKLRLVKLKPNIDLVSYVKALKVIENIKNG